MHDASCFGVWWTDVLTDIVHSQLIQHLFLPLVSGDRLQIEVINS